MTDISDDFSTTETLGAGAALESDIEHFSDGDAVRVDLVAGERYVFDLLGADGDAVLTLRDPMLQLLGADGALLADDDDSGAGLDSHIEFTASSSGSVWLLASGLGSIGTYRLTMATGASLADDFADGVATGGTLAAGGSVAGTADFTGDADWFAIDLGAGTNYAFRLAAQDSDQGTLGDPVLSLYDPAGTAIAMNDDGGDGTRDSLLSFMPATSGRYYLAATSYEPSETGTYLLSASTEAVDIPFVASTPATIAVGGSLESRIETADDRDAVRISLEGGERYVFDVVGTAGGLAQPALAVLDGDLAAVAETSGDGSASLFLTAPASGDYYLAVQSADGGTGGYRLAMRYSDDRLTGGSGDDGFDGLGGDDELAGGAGADSLSGGIGADRIDGGYGDDRLDGGDGDDRLAPGSGDDFVDGGAGMDTISLDGQPGQYSAVREGDGWLLLSALGDTRVVAVEQVEIGGAVTGIADFAAAAFDGLRYIASNADLIAAFGTDTGAARQHYFAMGHADGHRLASFDPYVYAASNPDVAAAFGTDAAMLTRHYIVNGAAEGRATATFDPLAYAAGNPDLLAVFGTDRAALTLHYLTSGRAEGRPAGSFDPLLYLASNPDLARAFGVDARAATLHYLEHGIAEARPTGGFDAYLYAAANPDVAIATHGDPAAMLRHYLVNGVAEGRATSGFDTLAYAASNTDLARAFGTDAVALAQHYVVHGMAEGRATASFDVLGYAAANPDLVQVLGDGRDALLRHYITDGLREGRPTAGFDSVAYLLSYADLAAAGFEPEAALRHWVHNGIGEGRAGDAAFGHDQPTHITVAGATTVDAIGAAGDRDWFGFTLHGGETATFDMAGTGAAALADPALTLFDAHGRRVAFDDDGGPGRDASLQFTAGLTGTYYLVATSADPAATGSYALAAHSDMFVI